VSRCRLESGTTGLLDPDRQSSRFEIALSFQGSGDRQCLRDRRMLQVTPVPQRARTEVVKCLPVEAHDRLRRRLAGAEFLELLQVAGVNVHVLFLTWAASRDKPKVCDKG